MNTKITEQKTINKIRNSITTAIQISLSNPEYSISGSIALMLLGHIKPRLPHDIDIVRKCTYEELSYIQNSSDITYANSGDSIFEDSATIRFTTRLKVSCGFSVFDVPITHDMFLMTSSYESFPFMDTNIRIHNPDVIWEAKRRIQNTKHLSEIFWRDSKEFKPKPIDPVYLPSWLVK